MDSRQATELDLEDATDSVVAPLPASWKQFHWKRRNKTAEVIKEKRRRNREPGYAVKERDYTFEAELDEQGRVLVDGCWFEGGGQIVRNSIALSTLLQRPIRVVNVRAKRTTSGLKSQHLAPIQFLASAYNCQFETNQVGPLEIKWTPSGAGAHNASANDGNGSSHGHNPVRKGRIDLGSAGSITLAIQAILPVLLFGDSPFSLELIGGTNVMSSPDIDWFIEVFIPTLNSYFKTNVVVQLEKRGYYPTGGGRVTLKGDVVPMCLEPIWVDHRGPVTSLQATVWSTGQVTQKSRMQAGRALYRKLDKYFRTHVHLIAPHEEADQQHQQESSSASLLRQFELDQRKRERKRSNRRHQEEEEEEEQQQQQEDVDGKVAPSPLTSERLDFSLGVRPETGVGQGRLGAIVVARSANGGCLGNTAMGGKGVTPAKVANSACSTLAHDLSKGGAFDQYLTDQLIVYMALAAGTSCIHTGPLTQHTLGAIRVACVVTGAAFRVEKVQVKAVEEERSYLLFCDGIGYHKTATL